MICFQVTNEGEATNEDVLESCIESVRALGRTYPDMHTLLLCPITQLSRAASYTDLNKVTVVSRPASLQNLYKWLEDVIGSFEEEIHSTVAIAGALPSSNSTLHKVLVDVSESTARDPRHVGAPIAGTLPS